MRKIAVFDFDGTITRKDTLLEFIKFSKGKWALLKGFLYYSPLLVAYKLGLYPNWKVKQKIFSYFYKGIELTKFNQLCKDFFNSEKDKLLYASAIKQIQKYKEEDVTTIIISASIINWVEPFGRYLNIDTILGTTIETDKTDKLTGHFLSPNCYGIEKVKRLKEVLPQNEKYYIIAYGDSKGDKELLKYANQGFYKQFKE